MIEIIATKGLKVMDSPAEKIRKPARARISARRRQKANVRKILRKVSKGACLACIFGEVSAIHLDCITAAVLLIISAFVALGAAIVLE